MEDNYHDGKMVQDQKSEMRIFLSLKFSIIFPYHRWLVFSVEEIILSFRFFAWKEFS